MVSSCGLTSRAASSIRRPSRVSQVAPCMRRGPRCMCSAQRPRIQLIATDVDGTLLNSKQELTPAVEQAIKKAADLGVPLVVATGKAPGCAWTEDVLPRLGPPAPGVFMQGNLVFNAKQELIYRRDLERVVVETAIDFAAKHGVTLVAYSISRIVTEKTDEHTDRLLFYGEPTPESIGPLRGFLNGGGAFQKIILMTTEEHLKEVRPLAVAALGDQAALTTALPGMLEVLPRGASKGSGVSRLLQELSIEPQCLMALGDGENDVEMLQLAGLGIAVANAGAPAKAAADVVLEETNDQDAVAKAIEKFVLSQA